MAAAKGIQKLVPVAKPATTRNRRLSLGDLTFGGQKGRVLTMRAPEGAPALPRSLLLVVGDKGVTLVGSGNQPQLNSGETGELLASLRRFQVKDLPNNQAGSRTRHDLEGTIRDLEKLAKAGTKLVNGSERMRTAAVLLGLSDRATAQWEAAQPKPKYTPYAPMSGEDAAGLRSVRLQDAMGKYPDGPVGGSRRRQQAQKWRDEDRSPE